MARNATNTLLHSAKKAKNDEFYTQLSDIERELKHYENHFRGKVIYCNCDIPKVSNFFNYFFENFERLGIKRLITSCYNETGKGFFFEKKLCRFAFWIAPLIFTNILSLVSETIVWTASLNSSIDFWSMMFAFFELMVVGPHKQYQSKKIGWLVISALYFSPFWITCETSSS